jgi:leucyl/phenylalanyl-tRNA--protein transferase
VIEACAALRDGTWINDEIREVYIELHRQGFGHSVECWEDNRLVGGLYGIALGKAFFGESMFSTATDASKIALVHLVEILREKDFQLLDCQFMTSHLAQFGAMEISRKDYQERLAAALKI